MIYFRLFILSISIFSFIGCQSNEIQKEQASQREDLHALEEKIGGLQGDIHAVQSENEALRSEVQRLKDDLLQSRDINTQYQKDIERLDGLLKKLDTAREQDRKIIVDEVSSEIGRLSQKISSSNPKGAATSKPKIEEGIEHTVSKGETLIAIAKAYGVSKKALMDANKLTKTDLKIGQKLFIPKK